MERLNDLALDCYLRGEGGELARRLAVQEVRRRAAQDTVTCGVCEKPTDVVLCPDCAAETTIDSLDLLDRLELAVESIADLPARGWAWWLVHILEALQAHADGKEYAAFLRDLRGDIDTRLREGGW